MNLLGYDWYIDDVYTCLNEFREGRYTAHELKDALLELSMQSFVRLRRYPKGAEITEIDTYEEYLEGPCNVIILFYDGGYCQIYAKDEAVTHNLYRVAEKYRFEDIEYVYGWNDGRTRMHF